MNAQQAKIYNAVKRIYKELEPIIINLYGRWQDEKEYEDIDDYSKPMERIVKKNGGWIDGMTKKPFGVRVVVEREVFLIYVKANAYGFKHIARKGVGNHR